MLDLHPATKPLGSDNSAFIHFFLDSHWRNRAIPAHFEGVDRSQLNPRHRSPAIHVGALAMCACVLTACAGPRDRVVDFDAPVAVRSGALVFDTAQTRESLQKQGNAHEVLRWEYARNNNAVGAVSPRQAFREKLHSESTWYAQPAPAPRYQNRAPGRNDRTIPLLSPARERWFDAPY